MFVIPGRTLHFRRGTIEEHPVTHEKYFVQTEDFLLVPNPANDHAPVYAPDWIKEDDLYKLVKKEKNMLVESVDGPSEEDEEPKPKHPSQQKGSGLQSGWKR
jgi:hypothetical protein